MSAYIYAIKNLVNNKMYIGSTKALNNRKYEHSYKLKKGNHHSIHLQRSYDKYGKDKFAFYILEECSKENRALREIYNIEYYKTYQREFGYNIYEPDETKFKCSDITKQKMQYATVLNGKCISVKAYDIKTSTLIGTYCSMNECANILGMKSATVSEIVRHKRKSYKGMTFLSAEEPYNYVSSNKQREMSKYYK